MSSETPASPPSSPLALPTPASVVRALRAPLIGFAITFAVAIAMVVLIAIAANLDSGMDSGSDSGVDENTIQAIGVLLAMPLQLVSLALFGNLHVNNDVGISTTFLAPPLGLTAVFLYVTARVARTAAPAADEGSRAVLAAAVGLVSAAVITPVTWAAAMRDDDLAMHAASVSLFLGAWIIAGLAVYVGSRRGAGVPRPAWIATEYAEAARLWFHQIVLWIAIALPVLVVAAIINEGVWLALLAPLWIITLGLDTYSLGHLGGVSAFTETIQAWDFDAPWTILMLVGAVLLTVLGSVAWFQRRDQTPTWLDNPTSWTVLPTVFFGAGLVVMLVPTVAFGGGFEGMGATFTVRPSPLVLAVLPVVGFVIEVLSRFVAPGLSGALPPGLVTRLRGTPLPSRVVGTPAAPGEAPAAPRPPLTDAEKAQWKRLAIIGGVVVVLLGGGWATISGINSAKYSAEATAEKYLDALKDGNVEKALELAGVDDEASSALLTDEIYGSAENTFTSYEIKGTESFGGQTRVKVVLKGLDGGSTDVDLSLRRDGKTGVFFTQWEITDGGLATPVSFDAPDGADSVSVNGTDVEVDDDGDFYLFPGTYDINPYGDNKWLTTDGTKTVVEAGSYGGYAEMPEVTASDAFRDEVDRQFNAYLDACMAATTIDPDGCPNSGYNSDAEKVRWTMTTAPTIDYDSFDGEFPADLSTSSGEASVSYEYDANYGFGPKDMVPQTDTGISLYPSVKVEEVGGGLKVSFGE